MGGAYKNEYVKDQSPRRCSCQKGVGSTEHFKVGDDVRVRNVKTLKWDLIGTVSKEIPSEDSIIRTYEVELSDRSFLVRNGKYMHHHTLAVPETSIGEDLTTERVQAPRLVTDFRQLNKPAAGPVTRQAAAKAAANLTVGLDNASQPARLPITGCVEQLTRLPTSV